MRYANVTIVVLFLFGVVACGDSSDPEADVVPNQESEEIGENPEPPPLGGKADGGPEIAEMGRLISPATTVVEHDAYRLNAFRIHGFGDTKIRVEANPVHEYGVNPVLAITGPLPQSPGRTVVFEDHRRGEPKGQSVEVTLEEPGAYRVIVGDRETYFTSEGAEGPIEVSFECLENCQLPHITLTELVEELQQTLSDEEVQEFFAASIREIFGDTIIADELADRLTQRLLDADVPDLEGFPSITLSQAKLIQGLFDSDTDPVAAPEAQQFDLEAISESECTPNRPELVEVDPRLPGLKRGGLPDYTHEDCDLRRTEQFAEVLNNLALDNGSAITHGEERFESVESAIRALLDSDHTIVAENNRYLANFLSLYHEGRTVAAPVWLDTGIELPEGGTLNIPAPHSHYTFRVDGPLFQGVVAFYMGIPGGTAFRPDSSLLRPNSWSGERTLTSVSSEAHPEKIVDLFVTAAELRKKWHEAGQELPHEGYGVLGVCNDSTALLELKTEGTVSLFPLTQSGDGEEEELIDILLAELPNDLEGFSEEEALDRIVDTMPFESSADMSVEEMPFPSLKRDLQSLQR